MSTPLRLLILEDNPSDLALVLDHLRTAGFTLDFRHAITQVEYLNQLDASLDLILADYCLPQYDGIKALQDMKERGLDIPFILISGTIGEDLAVDAMKQGACDYLLKDRLARLGQAVRRALDQSECRRARLQAKRVLRESEDRYCRLFNNSNDAVFVSPMTSERIPGRFIEVNDAACQRLGYSREELLRLSPVDLDAPEWLEKIKIRGTALLARKQLVFETEHVAKDGRRIPVEINARLFDLNGQTTVLSMVRDISDRKQNEADMRRLAEAVNQTAEAIVITSPAAVIEYVNPAFERITGYSSADAVGQTPRILKSGRQTEAFYQDLWHAITAGRIWSGRLINKRKDDSRYSEDCTISPIKNARGQIEHFVAIKRDVSKELQLEEQFRQAQKMEAVGQLAGGVAHDFNNILAAILMHLGLLLDDAQLTPETRSSLKELEMEAKRAANLTRQLLLFSRRQAPQLKPLDLNQVLADLVKMLRRLLGEQVDLVFQGSGTPMWIEADAGMMEQLVMNLAVNARDAMPKGGRLTIATRPVQLNAKTTQTNPETRPGSFVCLSVTDTGCGMDAATIKRIFEPFFTTKEVGHGTGLGLATVHGIVKQHQSWIEVESAPDQGTTFSIYLPALAQDVLAPAQSRDEKVRGGHETILLVEDEPSVRSVAARCLRRYGYRVLEALNGPEAMRQWEQQEGQIDLLFTDMVMPEGMTGLELAERLRKTNTKLKVIISSGYNVHMTVQGRPLAQGVVALAKPYQAETLAATVRKCLDQE